MACSPNNGTLPEWPKSIRWTQNQIHQSTVQYTWLFPPPWSYLSKTIWNQTKSAADLLTVVYQMWINSLDKGGEVCIFLLNIRCTFDQVWHNGLCIKLTSKGTTGRLHTWLLNYLQGRSIRVLLSGQSSSPCPNTSGVHSRPIIILYTHRQCCGTM